MRYLLFVLLYSILTSYCPARVIGQSVKGQSLKTHSISLTQKKRQPEIITQDLLFLSAVTEDLADEEMDAAFGAISEVRGSPAGWMTLSGLRNMRSLPSGIRVIWIHGSDGDLVEQIRKDSIIRDILLPWVEEGGHIVLTGRATHLLLYLGLEETAPADSLKRFEDKGYGRRAGFHAFRSHPLFSGMHGGAYLLRPLCDTVLRITGYFGDAVPRSGKVIGVDWDYIFLREDSRLVIEYEKGTGKVLAIGAYLEYSVENLHRDHLLRFTGNLFTYLEGRFEEPVHFWYYGENEVLPFTPSTSGGRLHGSGITETKSWNIPQDPMDLKRAEGGAEFWDVSGERIVAMGKESGGIEEVWSHPFMALRDFESGIRLPGSDSIIWLSSLRSRIIVSPFGLKREYDVEGYHVREMIVVDPSDPAGVVHYETDIGETAWFTIRFKTNLRLMWPYSERATGTIYHGWDKEMEALLVRDRTGDFGMMIGSGGIPVKVQKKRGTDFSLLAEITWSLPPNGLLDVVFATTADGDSTLYETYRQVKINPSRVFFRALEKHRRIQLERLMIITPDTNFNLGYRWALTGADRFFTHTPGMGKALVAGFSTTRRGWDGGQRVSGRPGYAWYFGRDAAWSGLALLQAGDFGKVRENLEFFSRFQDLNGKIFHEATTSGIVHYDAADATPLFILLAGRYFRHTYDTVYLRREWPSIRKAIDYCFSTDTDGDRLIENTNVGHGWVEGGGLYGSHSTIYMAGCWSAALRAAADMAEVMDDGIKSRLQSESQIQKHLINKDFWIPGKGIYAYGMNLDRSYRQETTVLPAVPLLFGLGEKNKAQSMLETLMSNRFATNWGMRILGDDSPWFKPTGYHYGSVWPLFTGWVSLAAYRYDLPVLAYPFLYQNLAIYRNWSMGFVEEVMNGAVYKPSGVCPHQCWSETMVLQPVIEGMLGIDPDAPHNRLTIAPALPAGWDSIRVNGIRMAATLAGFSYLRDTARITYRIFLEQGEPFECIFTPLLPPATEIEFLTINGSILPHTAIVTPTGVRLLTRFPVKGITEILIKYAKGFSVLPQVPVPAPGDSAAGLRIISATLQGDRYLVDVEGPAGFSGEIGFFNNGMNPVFPENERVIQLSDRILRYSVYFDPEGDRYVRKSIPIYIR